MLHLFADLITRHTSFILAELSCSVLFILAVSHGVINTNDNTLGLCHGRATSYLTSGNTGFKGLSSPTLEQMTLKDE